MQIIDHPVPGTKFIIHNQEADDWYNPPKPYTALEYEWVRQNLNLDRSTTVIDAGCHHGHYSLVFSPAYIIALDNDQQCIQYCKDNMLMNGVRGNVIYYELGERGAPVGYADIYKCDIEGAEFDLFPRELERFPGVHTWIIEIHPKKGDPEQLVEYFKDFELMKVDREKMIVRPYQRGETWLSHATLIAKKV